MTKPIERGVARSLRAEHGTPVKELARQLRVSPGTISTWVKDIEITPEQVRQNRSRAGRLRGDSWRELNRDRRREYQEEGRQRAGLREPMHLAGCMLYWAEGSKERNTLIFANSDPDMLRLFSRFLRESMGVRPAAFRIRLNVYLSKDLALREIEDHWLKAIGAPRSSLRAHTLDHYPTSSSGRRPKRLPYGTCTLKVNSTRLVQHIFGAIQEYGEFDERRWLDGPPRKHRKRRATEAA